MADHEGAFKRIGVVGAGSMGMMIAYGFSEHGSDVSIWDISSDNVDKALAGAKEIKSLKGKIDGFRDIHDFVKSLEHESNQRLFIFSVTHGNPADQVLGKIKNDLREGDIILDGGNEHYHNTERRQRELESKGISWIGMSVSGGYQSARRGPSISLGGDKKAVDLVLPLLANFAAKDPKSGQPCITYIGPAGTGHYVKMVHNGIEQGMLSTLCEAWDLLHHTLGLSNDEIGKVFEHWNSTEELKNTYLVQIGSEICQQKKTPSGDEHVEGKEAPPQHVLDDVLDRVVQDDDHTEGTGFWTVEEACQRHIAAPTIAAGHFFRVASGNRSQRLRVAEKLKLPSPHSATHAKHSHSDFIENLRVAVYTSFLAAFCQGLELIARASKDEGWNINLGTCIQIWRAGCIIQEEHIADLLQPILENSNQPIMNMKLIDEISGELRQKYSALKHVVSKAVDWDAYVPSLSASLEYLKYESGNMLATKFMEAELDYFGGHAYDKVSVSGEDTRDKTKGAHHYEWKSA